MKPDNIDTNKSETYKEIFYTCLEGILVVKEGKVILANPQCEAIFGYGTGELVGKRIEEFVPVNHRKGHVKVREKYTEKPDTRRMGMGRDLLAVRKDGSMFPVEISLNPADIKGETSIIAHIIDISKRKKAEDDLKRSEGQLLQYAAELEERVEERTRELADVVSTLKKTNESLEAEVAERIKAENETNIALAREKELNELKTRFVSTASHEFRTPLSTILSSVSLIGRYSSPDVKEKRLKHIERIKSNVGELTNILNDFLSLDKLDSGKMPLSVRRFDLCSLLKESISELSTLTKKGQNIDYKMDVSNCLVESDPQIIKQAFANLVSNAIKYSGEESAINVTVGEIDGQINITVVDRGIGIPQNDQKHLFEKFFRAHNSSHIQGTGLGLNIVQKYLELINGEITFESEEGKGSTFTILLNTSKNG